MSRAWTVVFLVGAATIVIKALGPVLLGGRALPARLGRVVALLAPALLAALVAINTFGSSRNLTLDARLLGVATAAVAIWRRAPILVVIVAAADVTALVRVA